jgi:hypothetical protein
MTVSTRSKEIPLGMRVESLLAGVLGALPQGSYLRYSTKAGIVSGPVSGVLYAVLFAGIPWFVPGTSHVMPELGLWGAVYFAFAATTAQLTSASVLRIIKCNILRELSEIAAKGINDDLARRFRPLRLNIVASFAALAATLATAFAFKHDVKEVSWGLIIWWCLGFFYVYFTAARTTYVARFYGSFAAHLKLMPEKLYPLDPARSIVVTHIASLGRRVMFFWTGIAAILLTLYPLFYRSLPYYVLLVMPLATFFSLGLGTITFIAAEFEIGRVANGILSSTVRSTEEQIAKLLGREDLTEAGSAKLKDLMSLHEKLSTSGWYKSVPLGVLSIITPFIGPVISALLSKYLPMTKG